MIRIVILIVLKWRWRLQILSFDIFGDAGLIGRVWRLLMIIQALIIASGL